MQSNAIHDLHSWSTWLNTAANLHLYSSHTKWLNGIWTFKGRVGMWRNRNPKPNFLAKRKPICLHFQLKKLPVLTGGFMSVTTGRFRSLHGFLTTFSHPGSSGDSGTAQQVSRRPSVPSVLSTCLMYLEAPPGYMANLSNSTPPILQHHPLHRCPSTLVKLKISYYDSDMIIIIHYYLLLSKHTKKSWNLNIPSSLDILVALFPSTKWHSTIGPIHVTQLWRYISAALEAIHQSIQGTEEICGEKIESGSIYPSIQTCIDVDIYYKLYHIHLSVHDIHPWIYM